MKILNLEGRHLVQAWRNQGHEVLSIGPERACDIRVSRTLSLSRLWSILREYEFFPDLVFWNDNCRPPSVIGFETLPCPCIGFSIDQYCNPWHVPYSAGFDLMLVAQKDYLQFFGRHPVHPEGRWFPLFCNPDRDWDRGEERDIPVGFVGTLDPPLNPERKPFLLRFKEELSLHMTTGDYVPVFNRCRLVLNQSAAGELNFRIFQAAACGAAVLTEECGNGLLDLFAPTRELFVYPRGNISVATRVCSIVLERPHKTAEVARRGREKVLRQHSAPVRAREVIRMAREVIRERTLDRRLGNRAAVARELAKAYMFLATDKGLPLTLELRHFYLQAAQKYQKAFPG
ncbi:MAG: glycosyltransferase [Desulfonatronovibrionaceae bacterium]